MRLTPLSPLLAKERGKQEAAEVGYFGGLPNNHVFSLK